MVFSSLIFLFLFLPVFLAFYYLTPYRWKNVAILVGSYIFYAWWRVDFLLLFAGTTLWNYWIGQRVLANIDTGRGTRWMQLGVAGDLLVLGIFKYFNFGVESINEILEQSGANTIEALRFILPIGISFYIFQSISYLIDLHRKDAPAPRRFVDFAAFISLFPQLIAGPVLRYKDLAQQFESRRHSMALFSRGAYRFMVGFAKKVLIADTVATLVDKTFALEDPTMADAWLGILAYAVQLYFDFSGYSDMAIGLGMMMGFRFVENFNFPYISRSITEFWRRWHISLSAWLRDYLYIPLGGNRKGTVRTYVNLFLTMVLGGLWHGANWTFVAWGAWHGGVLAIERALGVTASSVPDYYRSLRSLAAMSATFLIVLIGWVLFRSPDIGYAFNFYSAMFGLKGIGGLSEAIDWQIGGAAVTALVAGYLFIFAVPALQAAKGFNLKEARSLWVQSAIVGFFLLAVIKLAAQSYSPFLYFQF
ncbi:MAG: MBOAT family protein [Alphaproteobacteria bacterium]|nr:MBOAT family protein [Alphaproteobacteria bacterium]